LVNGDTTATTRLTPTSSLGNGAIYTLTIAGATDVSGNGRKDSPSWSFTTVSTSIRRRGRRRTDSRGDSGDQSVHAASRGDPHAEGLNEFDGGRLATRRLSGRLPRRPDGRTGVDDGAGDHADQLVSTGGNLIAMRPDTKLSTVLGLGAKG
jgi:hypothetical protein